MGRALGNGKRESEGRVPARDVDEFVDLLPVNHVELVGRLSAPAIERELPSGDRVVEFRLVIGRELVATPRRSVTPANQNKSSRLKQRDSTPRKISLQKNQEPLVKVRSPRREVDTLDIAVWGSRLRKRALALRADDWVQVTGAVRRRFWQAPYGLASRWQVEALDIVLIQRSKASG